MTEQHPITPPLELVEQWYDDSENCVNCVTQSARWGADQETYIITQAARWGADQELEACVDWMRSHFHGVPQWADQLRSTRRPKPPSLKEQALETLRQMHIDPETGVSPTALDTIRRALEQLDD